MHVREAAIDAVVIPGELLMIEAKQVQNSGPKIMNGGWVFSGATTEVVRGSPGSSFPDTGTKHPDGGSVGVVIPAQGAFLMSWHAAEFSGPEHQRVLQQPSRFEIGDEPGGGPIKDWKVALVIGFECFVSIPVEEAVDARGSRGAEKLNVANTAFDETAGEQTIFGVGGD